VSTQRPIGVGVIGLGFMGSTRVSAHEATARLLEAEQRSLETGAIMPVGRTDR
jgi:hypothetical protein